MRNLRASLLLLSGAGEAQRAGGRASTSRDDSIYANALNSPPRPSAARAVCNLPGSSAMPCSCC